MSLDGRIDALMKAEGISREEIVHEALEAYLSAKGDGKASMTFDELAELYRAEMVSCVVTESRKDLYQAMADLKGWLRGNRQRLAEKDSDSVMVEGAEHREKSAERLRRDITRIRAEKVWRMAFLAALGSESRTDALTDEEKEYYEKARETASAHLKSCLDPGESDAQDEAPKTVQQALPIERGSKETRTEGMPLSRIIKAYLRDGQWRDIYQIVRAVRQMAPGFTKAQVAKSLERMTHEGDVERYPPVVEGRRPRRAVCEWRLREGSE